MAEMVASKKNAPIRAQPIRSRAKAKRRAPLMEIDRDTIVSQLRELGHDDKADQAEKELPQNVDTDQHKGLLDKIGVDDTIVDKLPGGLADKTLKDIL